MPVVWLSTWISVPSGVNAGATGCGSTGTVSWAPGCPVTVSREAIVTVAAP